MAGCRNARTREGSNWRYKSRVACHARKLRSSWPSVPSNPARANMKCGPLTLPSSGPPPASGLRRPLISNVREQNMRIHILSMTILLASCAAPPKIGNVGLPRSFTYSSPHEVTINLPEKYGFDSPVFLSCYNTTNHRHNGDPTIAKQTYKYALMASNSYHAEATFVIPDWTPTKHYRGDRSGLYEIGFQADQYENPKAKEIALVFRGTDNSSIDHKANFAMWWPWSGARAPAQYQFAKNLATQIHQANPDYKIILVGHSLGGGMAFHASWDIPNSETYGFDPSPRTWVSGDPQPGKRYVVREHGEILQYIQFWNSLPVDDDKDREFNFIGGTATREHNMYYLARGLLLLATQSGDSKAKETMDTNLGCSAYNITL